MASRTDRERPGVLAAMAADVAAGAVPADVAARIKARALGRIADAAAPASGFIEVLADAGWLPFGPGAQMKVLFDDGSTRSWMVRLQAGVELPAHEHDDGAEECLVLDGDLWLDDAHFGPGDYQLAARGTRHGKVRSEGGCLLFVRSPSPRPDAGRAAGSART